MNKQSNKVLINISSYLLVLFFITLVSNNVTAQDVNTRISKAIQSGSSTELSKFFNNSIDLTIPESEGTYSKVQAEQILKSFFLKYPPVSFTINHKGNSNDGSVYAIGTYKSKTNSFRTYYLSKPVEGQLLIHQLKFETRED
ncbi:MAG TPA: DUF4783 domain-containing protein [Lentimicrobium sp.]|nr:DUF4783 domain-containing protein [Lentimicrobium sp.]